MVRKEENHFLHQSQILSQRRKCDAILLFSSQSKECSLKKHVNAQKYYGGSRHYYYNINYIKLSDVIGCFRKIQHKRKLYILI